MTHTPEEPQHSSSTGASRGPLAGIRVLDLAGESGLFAGRLLGEMGADVVRIEPAGGDAIRRRPPFLDGEVGDERSLHHLHFNVTKRSVTIDIEMAEGAALLRRLAAVADVLIETAAVGEMDARGLGYEALRSENPGLIYATITPFGQVGPMRHYHGSDVTAVASGGLMWLNGFPDGQPTQPGAEQGYHMGSLVAAASIAAAIVGRGRGDGAGRRIDVSLQEAVALTTLQHASPNVYAWHRNIPARVGARSPRGRHLYQCADGLWVSFVISPFRWNEFLEWCRDEGIGEHLFAEEWQDASYRLERGLEVAKVVDVLTSRHPRKDLFHEGQRRKLSVMPSNTVPELLEDEQLAARDYFIDVPHAETGRTLRDSGVAAQLSRTPASITRPAPRLGAHTREVLTEWLGLHDAEVEHLLGTQVAR